MFFISYNENFLKYDQRSKKKEKSFWNKVFRNEHLRRKKTESAVIYTSRKAKMMLFSLMTTQCQTTTYLCGCTPLWKCREYITIKKHTVYFKNTFLSYNMVVFSVLELHYGHLCGTFKCVTYYFMMGFFTKMCLLNCTSAWPGFIFLPLTDLCPLTS